MNYSWKNDQLWQIRISEKDFDDFEQPYVGNGIIGTRFGKLVAGTDRKPLSTLARDVYDGGRQMLLPAWNHIFLEVGGISYTPENGRHHAEQVLDIRNGVVSMTDHWEYKNGKAVAVTVEMFIPRGFGHASYLSFEVENPAGKPLPAPCKPEDPGQCQDDKVSVKFGMLGTTLRDHYFMDFLKTDDFIVVGNYRTMEQDRPVSQAIKWRSAGLDTFHADMSSDCIEVTADACNDNIKLELFHAISSYNESSDTCFDVSNRVRKLYDLGRDAMLDASAVEWKNLWRNGIAFRNDDFQIEKSVLVHQFHLMCSLEECDHPLGPLGLSKNEWCGSQLWDADLWVFRAVLPLWPDYARSIVDFRRKTLDMAKEHARAAGYKGAWYGWMTDDEGRNITPPGYNDELHLNIWIAMAAWEYYLLSGDKEFLCCTGWPIISDIADFFASRAEIGSDGQYHLNCVLGPDESVYECGNLRVNDNFTTNYGVKRLMETACKAADVLQAAANAKWKEVGEKIYLLSPDANGIIAEYKGYDGHGIKQADVILSFYPLGFDADPGTVLKNIKFYRDKQMYYGPLMSSQIESCILMRLKEKEKGLKRLFQGMAEFSRGKHFIPFECRDNDNSIMLTGIAGELQALIYGYYEAGPDNIGVIPRIAQYMD